LNDVPEQRLLVHVARNAIRDIRVKYLWIIPCKIYKSYPHIEIVIHRFIHKLSTKYITDYIINCFGWRKMEGNGEWSIFKKAFVMLQFKPTQFPNHKTFYQTIISWIIPIKPLFVKYKNIGKIPKNIQKL